MAENKIYSYGETTPSLFVSLYGFEKNKDTAHWGPGIRNNFILQFVTKGKGYFNGELVTDGQAFLITPYTQIEYHPDKEEPWEYFWLNFTGMDVPELFRSIHIDCTKNQIFDYDFKGWLLDFVKDVDFYEEQNKSGLYGNAIFYMIYSLLKEYTSIAKNDKKSKHVNAAIHYIRNNFHKKISVVDVANSLGLNRCYLASIFKEKLNASPASYIENLRLTKAKELLQTTNFKINEIASAVGFDDQFHFCKFFKKSEGVSPLQYRKQLKNKS